MREAINNDVSAYWEYVILYVDDSLCISMNAGQVLKNEIKNYLLIKPSPVKYPNIYLCKKVSKVTLDNGVEARSFSSSQQVQNSVSNVETYINKLYMKLPNKVLTQFTSGYLPDLDITPELDAK